MELHTRARALDRPAAIHPHLLVHNHSTEKRGFYDRSLFYICKNMQKIYPLSLTHLCVSLVRQYKRKIYIRIHIIYTHAFIHICIMYNIYIYKLTHTHTHSLSAYNISFCARAWVSHFYDKK